MQRHEAASQRTDLNPKWLYYIARERETPSTGCVCGSESDSGACRVASCLQLLIGPPCQGMTYLQTLCLIPASNLHVGLVRL